jgi:hypothetical protein
MYVRVAFLLVAVLCAGACGDNNTGLTTTPTPTPTTRTTEPTYTDTLTVNGARIKQFSTTGRGTVTVTLTAVGPDSTAVVGLALGTWNGLGCQVIIDYQLTQGTSFDGNVSGVGSLCVRVYDPGTLTAPVTFSVDVSHP